MPWTQTIQTRRAVAIERRQRVAELRRAGVTSQWTIAEQLGVSRATVSRDCAILNREWRAQAQVDTATVIGLELTRLDALQDAVWSDALAGRTSAVMVALRIAERRAKLLGLDAPERTEVTGADGGPVQLDALALTPQQRDHEILSIVQAAAARALNPPSNGVHPDA